MTDKTQKLIEQALADRKLADGARTDVANSSDAVKAADERLNQANAKALEAHTLALTSAHAALDSLSEEVEQQP